MRGIRDWVGSRQLRWRRFGDRKVDGEEMTMVVVMESQQNLQLSEPVKQPVSITTDGLRILSAT